jgi:hypothetical protein
MRINVAAPHRLLRQREQHQLPGTFSMDDGPDFSATKAATVPVPNTIDE